MKANGLALVSAVLKGCFVFAVTAKEIELQTWDWSCFEDIYEKICKSAKLNRRLPNVPSTQLQEPPRIKMICHKIATTRAQSYDVKGPLKTIHIFNLTSFYEPTR